MQSFRGGFYPSIYKSYKIGIHFITDSEGHFPSFANSVNKSNIIKFDQTGQLQFQSSNTKSYFIFGGDLTDRGVNDTKLTEILLDFKMRHKDQVILLVGNREASKTRFFIELNPKHIRERLRKGGAPFWIANPLLPIDYVKKYMNEKGKGSGNLSDVEEYIEFLDIKECQLIYLRWMLEQNLSCFHTFSYHAQQLAEKLGCELKELSDFMVLESLMEQTSPNGLMGQYIKQTQIAAIIPEAGILAVHGGLTAENIGRLPTMKPTDRPIENLQSWLKEFNIWYKFEVEKWAGLNQYELPLELNPARSTLDTFSIRVPSEYRSIVTASMLDQNRRFTEVPDTVSDYLYKNKISLVLSGHQPCSDYPAILRSKNDHVVFINGDNSYANSGVNDVHDTRGLAYHSLQFFVKDHVSEISIDARLTTGEFIQNSLTIVEGKLVTNSHIGKILPGNELVQCFWDKYDCYRTVYQEGFKVQYNLRTKAEIDDLLQSNYEMEARVLHNKFAGL